MNLPRSQEPGDVIVSINTFPATSSQDLRVVPPFPGSG